MLTPETIQDLFTYHAPDEKQIEQLQAVREHAKTLALIIVQHCPPCADTSAAIRLLRQAVMTANAAIALRGRG